MMTSPRVVFFGNEQLCTGLVDEKTPIFDALLEAGYDIAAVVLRSDAPKGRSNKPVASLVKQKALARGIAVIQPQTNTEMLSELQIYSGSIGVLASFGRIVPQTVIDLFEPYGIINIHPSLLPRYRGSSPIEATVLNGDTKAGVSLMRLVAAMDEGPLLGQTMVTLAGNETKLDLYDILSGEGAKLLISNLPSIISGQLKPIPQQNDDVSYTSRISKQDGIIDPETEAADIIVRKVRTHLNFPKSRVKFRDGDVIITSAVSSDSPSHTLPTLSCKDGRYVHIQELVASNGKRMSGEAYLRGLR